MDQTMEPYLISAVVALAGAVGILWKRSDSSLSWLRKAYDDIVTRVRKLEDERIVAERSHGHEIKALASDMIASRKEDRRVTNELIETIRRMPCKMEAMQDQSNVETATLSKKVNKCPR